MMNQSIAPPLSAIQSSSSKLKNKPPKVDALSPTERVVLVVEQLASTMHTAIDEIREINENAKLLSLNARIEAARAGSSGAAFGVVAQEMQALSMKTADVADDMANKTQESIHDLITMIGGNVRGTRLADIALNSIDLVDRNLYERTCDVRWWATDSSLVDALVSPSAESFEHASRRMGIILNAYTVYHDLILCDLNGRIIANGRPNMFDSVGRNESKSIWFKQAMATSSGNEFAFQSAHPSHLVGDQSVLIYSATVRRHGEANEPIVGVLGVVFNWEALSNAILCNASFDAKEAEKTMRFIVDGESNILASSRSVPSNFKLPKESIDLIGRPNKGYVLNTIDGKEYCMAYAKSPGFETYSTGWYSLLIQEF